MLNVSNNHYQLEFQAFEKNGASQSPEWVNDVRKSAYAAFMERGFPTTREEDWKYTSVASIAKAPFKYASHKLVSKVAAETVQSFLVTGVEQHLLVFVNGHLSK